MRTVTVATRDKRKGQRERPNTCKAGLTEMKLAIQRLVVLLPVEENWKEGIPNTE